MIEKNINFDDEKIKKSEFYQKKAFQIDDGDVNKILVPKKELFGIVQRMHLDTLLDIMVMILLDHYVCDFHK